MLELLYKVPEVLKKLLYSRVGTVPDGSLVFSGLNPRGMLFFSK
jgi:hypothetical protein